MSNSPSSPTFKTCPSTRKPRFTACDRIERASPHISGWQVLCPTQPPTSALITDNVILPSAFITSSFFLTDRGIFWQRITVYGNQMAMVFIKHTSLGLLLALLLLPHVGCAPRLSPAVPAGIALQPGRYLTAYYRAPDFAPANETYSLEPFT